MDPTAAAIFSLLAAVALAAAWGKPAATWVSGLITKDKKGRYALVLSPKKRKGKKRR